MVSMAYCIVRSVTHQRVSDEDYLALNLVTAVTFQLIYLVLLLTVLLGLRRIARNEQRSRLDPILDASLAVLYPTTLACAALVALPELPAIPLMLLGVVILVAAAVAIVVTRVISPLMPPPAISS